jgi:hypothetical protein
MDEFGALGYTARCFRKLAGEAPHWVYDRYSLGHALIEAEFG